MECLDANVVQQLIEGELGPSERRAVEDHLGTCETCQNLVAALSPDEHAAATEEGSPRRDVRVSTVRPRNVERYEIAEPLGEGGMGIVYAAYDPELHREVALKLLRPTAGAAGDTTGARARLLREAQAMARIAHPNVIAVYDVGVWESQVFVAMELAPKGTLRKWQSVPGRAWHEILDAYLAAGRGLVAAHEAGLVHRDFKPDNVLVGADGRMRVTDFGLARTDSAPPDADAAASGMLDMSLTITGALMGTPAYMAPEQIDGQPADARCDQFAFCVALWEALYGRRPFAGATLADVREAIERQAVSAPKSDVALPVQRGLLRGLAARPDDRWPTMAALLGALTPRRSPRTSIAIGLAAAVIVGGAVSGIGTWLGRHDAATCTPPAMPATWMARRVALATHIPPDVARQVDGWFDAWTAAAATTCTRDRDDLVLRRRRSRCLVALLDDADVQLAHWEDGKEVAPQEAHEAVETLPRVSRCTDAAQRAVVDPAPAQLAAVRALEVALAHAHAHEPALRALATQARALDHAPLDVAVAIELSTVEFEHDRDAAARTMRDAMARADRQPAEVPRIISRLQLIAILGSSRPDETIQLIETARHLIGELGGDAELESNLESLVGDFENSREHPEVAVVALERARNGFQIAYGPDSQHEMNALIKLAGAYSRRDPNGADVRAARDAAIAINRRTGVEMNLGMFGAIGDPKTLIASAQEALANARRTNVGRDIAHGEYNLGIAYFLDDQWQPTLEHLQAAIAKADEIGLRNELIANANERCANLLVDHGRAAEAMPPAQRGVALAEAVADETQLGFSLTALGNVQLATGDRKAARQTLERALTTFDKAHAPAEGRGPARFLLATAIWPSDHRRAIDLAHASRADAQSVLDAMADDDPSKPGVRVRTQRRVDKIDRWLATHR